MFTTKIAVDLGTCNCLVFVPGRGVVLEEPSVVAISKLDNKVLAVGVEAKSMIGAALTGLVLALTSYLILNTINPALVNLQVTNINSVSELKTGTGSCTTIEDQICTDNITEKDCINRYANFVPGGKCTTSCCATLSECSDINITLEQCKDAATKSNSTFVAYMNNGK